MKSKYRNDLPTLVEESAESHAPMTDEQVAEVCGVSEKTVKVWYKKYPEFLMSVRKAKAVNDERVVRSLFERATGYSVPDVHITISKGEVTKTAIIKHYPPDPTSCIFWLKNRLGWKDKHDIAHSGDIDLHITDYSKAESVNFNDDGSPKSQD